MLLTMHTWVKKLRSQNNQMLMTLFYIDIKMRAVPKMLENSVAYTHRSVRPMVR